MNVSRFRADQGAIGRIDADVPVIFDYDLPLHPKAIEAGSAMLLFFYGLAHCAKYLTDGFIAEKQLPFLGVVANAKKDARTLVNVGLWERVDSGYRVRNYDKHNPSAEATRRDREAARERMRRIRSGEHSPEHSPNNGRSSETSSPVNLLPNPISFRSKANDNDGAVAVATARSELRRDDYERGLASARATPSPSRTEGIAKATDAPATAPDGAAAATSLFDQAREVAGIQCDLATLARVFEQYPALTGSSEALLDEMRDFAEKNAVQYHRRPTVALLRLWLKQWALKQAGKERMAQGLCAICGAPREPLQRKYCYACRDGTEEASAATYAPTPDAREASEASEANEANGR